MKKILFSVMAVVLCLGLMGGAFAYFSDVEESTGNTFTAGTLNLELGGSSGDNIWVSLNNWAPAETVTGTLELENSGSVDIGWIGIKPVDVVVTEGLDSFPDKIIITNFTMSDPLTGRSTGNLATGTGLANMANWGAWGPADGVLTLADFASGPYYFYSEPTDWLLKALRANTVSLTMEFQFDPEANNDYQDADCNFGLRVVAVQYNSPGPPNFTHIGDAGCGYGSAE